MSQGVIFLLGLGAASIVAGVYLLYTAKRPPYRRNVKKEEVRERCTWTKVQEKKLFEGGLCGLLGGVLLIVLAIAMSLAYSYLFA